MVVNLIENLECSKADGTNLMHSKVVLTNIFYITSRIIFPKDTRVTKMNKTGSPPSRSPQSNEDLPVLPFNCVT